MELFAHRKLIIIIIIIITIIIIRNNNNSNNNNKYSGTQLYVRQQAANIFVFNGMVVFKRFFK